MNLKPIYDTGTITFMDAPKSVTLQKIDASFIKDPQGVIPNGIFKVFKNEKHKQLFVLAINASVILVSIILISIFLTALRKNVNWFWNIPLFIALGLSLTKFVFVLLDLKNLSSSIKLYRESLIAGSKLTPPFISNMYIKLYKNQVSQNWLVIFFMFYGIVITILFWWLKDVNWGIFQFKTWIDILSQGHSQLIGGIMITILVFVLILHIYFTVYRKKRIIDIQSFFGNEVVSQVEISTITEPRNSFYKKMFWTSILIVLIFPFIIRFIYKKVKK